MDRLSDIRNRASAATAGPWKITNPRTDWWPQGIVGAEANICGIWDGGRSQAEGLPRMESAWADAEFISNAREDIPFLLNYISELEKNGA